MINALSDKLNRPSNARPATNRIAELKGPGAREAKNLILEKREKAWVELALKYGKSFYYQGALVTCDRRLVETLLADPAHTEHRSVSYKFMGRLIPGARGPLFADGAEWRRYANALKITFTKSHVESYGELIRETALNFAARWGDEERLSDLFAAMTELGAEIMLRVGCGLDPRDESARKLGKELIGYKAQTMTAMPRLDQFGFTLGQLLELPAMLIGLVELRQRVRRIGALLDEVQPDHSAGRNWVGQLRQAGLSRGEITDVVNHLYGAYTASDFILTCAFYELSRHPEWADILRREFREDSNSQRLAELNFIEVLRAILQHYEIHSLNHQMRRTPYLIPRFEGVMPCLVRRIRE